MKSGEVLLFSLMNDYVLVRVGIPYRYFMAKKPNIAPLALMLGH